jgi:hypothetical protein
MKTFLLASFLVTATAAAQSYTLTGFGSHCGGDLHAQIVAGHPTGHDLLFAVNGARPNALAVLGIGHQLAAPVHLPGQCLLLVEPLDTMLTTTSPGGTAHFAFHLPPVVPISIDFQAVIVGHSHHHGLVVESTDGVRLTGA